MGRSRHINIWYKYSFFLQDQSSGGGGQDPDPDDPTPDDPWYIGLFDWLGNFFNSFAEGLEVAFGSLAERIEQIFTPSKDMEHEAGLIKAAIVAKFPTHLIEQLEAAIETNPQSVQPTIKVTMPSKYGGGQYELFDFTRIKNGLDQVWPMLIPIIYLFYIFSVAKRIPDILIHSADMGNQVGKIEQHAYNEKYGKIEQRFWRK